MFPWVLAAIIVALIISRSITLLSLGEDIAVGLGQRTGLIKLIGLIVVLILAGTAVSVVGAVGFVGLIIPTLHVSWLGSIIAGSFLAPPSWAVCCLYFRIWPHV